MKRWNIILCLLFLSLLFTGCASPEMTATEAEVPSQPSTEVVEAPEPPKDPQETATFTPPFAQNPVVQVQLTETAKKQALKDISLEANKGKTLKVQPAVL